MRPDHLKSSPSHRPARDWTGLLEERSTEWAWLTLSRCGSSQLDSRTRPTGDERLSDIDDIVAGSSQRQPASSNLPGAHTETG